MLHVPVPPSLEEGSDHGGTNFDAAQVQFFDRNVASSLCRRDTGRALATHFDGQIDLHTLCASRCPLVFQRVRQFGIGASLPLDHLTLRCLDFPPCDSQV